MLACRQDGAKRGLGARSRCELGRCWRWCTRHRSGCALASGGRKWGLADRGGASLLVRTGAHGTPARDQPSELAEQTLSRGRARKALAELIDARPVLRTRGGASPRYDLPPLRNRATVNRVWLPNTLVTGAANETPPIERVRQTRDPMTLRLLVDCYHASYSALLAREREWRRIQASLARDGMDG